MRRRPPYKAVCFLCTVIYLVDFPHSAPSASVLSLWTVRLEEICGCGVSLHSVPHTETDTLFIRYGFTPEIKYGPQRAPTHATHDTRASRTSPPGVQFISSLSEQNSEDLAHTHYFRSQLLNKLTRMIRRPEGTRSTCTTM